MDLKHFDRTEFGQARRTLGQDSYVAYFPLPMPRSIRISEANLMLMADAEAELGRLIGIGPLLPDPSIFMRTFINREAVASTRIEGTQASLTDLYDAEVSDRPYSDDVREVVNYVRAMEYAVKRLSNLPLSVRLIKETHAVILEGVRGQHKQPGELRTSQNWIGPPGAKIDRAEFVPPPPEEVAGLLADLEQFIHDPPTLPPLVQAALLHYQFESIHPFLDGNGRLGRLLIILFLIHCERLDMPLLQVSPYFEARRDEYYAALQGVRTHGDSESWLRLFLSAVRHQASDAAGRAIRLLDLRERYRQTVQARTRGAANRLVDFVFLQPVMTSRWVVQKLEISRPTALEALHRLEELKVLAVYDSGSRGQLIWRATEVLTILSEE